MVELTLPVVVAAALIDSINPCAIGIMVLLLSYFAILKARAKIIIASIVYITSVYITYLLLGLGILSAVRFTGLTVPFYYVAAAVAITAGIVEIKDYFWYGRWFSFSVPKKAIAKLEKIARKTTIPLIALLGVFVMLIELPCTGQAYFAILGLLAAKTSWWTGFLYLLFYNLLFVLPLILIAGLYIYGTTAKVLDRWRKKYRHIVRLLLGLFLIGLGIWMLWSII